MIQTEMIVDWPGEHKLAVDPDVLKEIKAKIDTALAGVSVCTNWAVIKKLPNEPVVGEILPLTSETRPTAGDILEFVNLKDDVFKIKLFKFHDINIGILIVITSGPKSGARFLIAPNVFPDDINNRLQFLRAVDTASDNLETGGKDGLQI